jgi:hypothetical protein
MMCHCSLAGSVGIVLHSASAAAAALLPTQRPECGCKALACGACWAGLFWAGALKIACLCLMLMCSLLMVAEWCGAQHCQRIDTDILCGSVL